MNCSFCDENITDEPIYELCETRIELVEECFREHIYCSRLCAIAADFLFSLGIEQIINEEFQSDDHDDDAHSDAFDQVVEDVMKECGCTYEELLDAFTRIEVVIGEFPDIVDKKLLKYQ